MTHELLSEKIQVQRRSDFSVKGLSLIFKVHWYPLNFYLINHVKNINVFFCSKSFNFLKKILIENFTSLCVLFNIIKEV